MLVKITKPDNIGVYFWGSSPKAEPYRVEVYRRGRGWFVCGGPFKTMLDVVSCRMVHHRLSESAGVWYRWRPRAQG